MADTVAVMNKGHIEQLGGPGRALRPAAHAVRRQLPRAGQHRRRHHQGHRRRPPRRRRARHSGEDPQVPLTGARGRGAVRRTSREGHRLALAARRRRQRRQAVWCATCPSSGVATSYLIDMPSGTTWSCYEQNLDVEPLDLRPGRRGLAHLEPRPRLRRAGGGRMTAFTQAAVEAEPPTRRRRRPETTKRSWTAYLLLLPGVLWLGVFFILPLVQLASVSLQSRYPGYPGLLLPRPQLRQLRQRAHRLRAALRPVLPLRRPGHVPGVRRGLPAGLRDGVQGRAVAQPDDDLRRGAVLHLLHPAHLRVVADPGRRGLGGRHAQLPPPAARAGTSSTPRSP